MKRGRRGATIDEKEMKVDEEEEYAKRQIGQSALVRKKRMRKKRGEQETLEEKQKRKKDAER